MLKNLLRLFKPTMEYVVVRYPRQTSGISRALYVRREGLVLELRQESQVLEYVLSFNTAELAINGVSAPERKRRFGRYVLLTIQDALKGRARLFVKGTA